MTDNFHQRLSADQAEQFLQQAWLSGVVDDDAPAWIVHDLGRMRERLVHLQQTFPPPTLHALAIKANPLVEVLREAVACGAGLEAASIEEVELALAADCPRERIVFDSPAKTAAEIRRTLGLGILLNANTLDELDRIGAIAEELAGQLPSASPRVGLRVNPQVSAGTIAATSVGHAGSKFGVRLHDQRDEIFDAYRRWSWLSGIHVHVGSQGCSLELLVEAARKVSQLVSEIEAATARPLQFVDLGGGLPAVYEQQATPPSPTEYVHSLRRAVPELMSPSRQRVTEFGRAVQAGCGIAYSRVEYVRDGGAMAVIHLGADFLLRPVYAPRDWKHEFLVFDARGRLKRSAPIPLTIAGPLCFSGDILARDVPLPQVAPGDWIAIRDVGAYTLSMWSRHCSRGIPPVIGHDARRQPAWRLLRGGESPETVRRYWSLSAPSESEPRAPSESEPRAPSESEPRAPSESEPEAPSESER